MPDLEDKIIRNSTIITLFFGMLTLVYKGILAMMTNKKSVRELRSELEKAQEEITELKERHKADKEYLNEKLNNHHAAIELLRQQLFDSLNK